MASAGSSTGASPSHAGATATNQDDIEFYSTRRRACMLLLTEDFDRHFETMDQSAQAICVKQRVHLSAYIVSLLQENQRRYPNASEKASRKAFDMLVNGLNELVQNLADAPGSIVKLAEDLFPTSQTTATTTTATTTTSTPTTPAPTTPLNTSKQPDEPTSPTQLMLEQRGSSGKRARFNENPLASGTTPSGQGGSSGQGGPSAQAAPPARKEEGDSPPPVMHPLSYWRSTPKGSRG